MAKAVSKYTDLSKLKFLSITEGTPAQIEWANKLATNFLKYETRSLSDEELETVFNTFGKDALFWINSRISVSTGAWLPIMRKLGRLDENYNVVA
jgi:hypothetical protein